MAVCAIHSDKVAYIKAALRISDNTASFLPIIIINLESPFLNMDNSICRVCQIIPKKRFIVIPNRNFIGKEEEASGNFGISASW